MADYLRDGVNIPNPDPIRVPWDFDRTGGDIAVQQIFPTYDGVLDRDVLLRHAQQRRRWIREKFAIGLLEAIEQSKDPVVVSVDEQIIMDYFGKGRDRYKLAARLTPTHTRNVVFAKDDPFTRSFIQSVIPKPSFRQRLKFLFTGDRKDLK